jgi:hypothetical protein
MMVALREKGYTYEAIAQELYLQGLTETEVSRSRIKDLFLTVAPHLMGDIKRKMGLSKLIRKKKY